MGTASWRWCLATVATHVAQTTIIAPGNAAVLQAKWYRQHKSRCSSSRRTAAAATAAANLQASVYPEGCWLVIGSPQPMPALQQAAQQLCLRERACMSTAAVPASVNLARAPSPQRKHTQVTFVSCQHEPAVLLLQPIYMTTQLNTAPPTLFLHGCLPACLRAFLPCVPAGCCWAGAAGGAAGAVSASSPRCHCMAWRQLKRQNWSPLPPPPP